MCGRPLQSSWVEMELWQQWYRGALRDTGRLAGKNWLGSILVRLDHYISDSKSPQLLISGDNQQLSIDRWTAANYTFFWGLTLINGVKYRLGTLQPQRSVADMNEIQIKSVPDLPESFDTRVGKWAKFIHPVRDQGNCGASWAFSTTSKQF